MADSSNGGGNTESFWTSLLLSGAIGLVLLGAFTVFLRRRFPDFYMPRVFLRKRFAPQLNRNRSMFSWITYTLRFPDGRLFVSREGMDPVVYLKWLKYTVFLFAALSLITLPVLLPINIMGENKNKSPSDPEYVGDRINWLTMANVEQGSHRLWAHLAMVFAVSFVTYYYLYCVYQSNVLLQVRYARKSPIQARTIMISELPAKVKTDRDLFEYFAEMYSPDVILNAVMAPKIASIRSKKEDRKDMLDNWRYANAIFRETGTRPTMRDVGFNLRKKKGETVEETEAKKRHFLSIATVDAITHTQDKLQEFDNELVTKQRGNDESTRCGFITFNTISNAITAAQTQHDPNPSKLKTYYGLDPNNVSWTNLSVREVERVVRKLTVVAFIVALFFFWAIPVTFIGALISLDSLSRISGLGWLVDVIEYNSFVSGLVQGFLPTAALVVFMALLPLIFRKLYQQMKYYTHSEVDEAVMSTYFTFLLLNVFLVVTIAGSLFGTLKDIIDHPGSIVESLANSLPLQAIFFTNYIAIEGFIGFPMALLRITDLILVKLKQFFKKTKLQKQDVQEKVGFEYPEQLAQQLLIFVIALTYSIMFPIILPLATLFFFLAYLMAKYHFIFVHVPPYHGFKMIPHIVWIITIGLLIFQATMIGLFSIKYFPAGIAVAILLVTTIVWRIILDRRFAKASVMPSMREAVHLDRLGQMRRIPRRVIRVTYTDPALKPPVPLEETMREDIIMEQEYAKARPPSVWLDESIDDGKEDLDIARQKQHQKDLREKKRLQKYNLSNSLTFFNRHKQQEKEQRKLASSQGHVANGLEIAEYDHKDDYYSSDSEAELTGEDLQYANDLEFLEGQPNMEPGGRYNNPQLERTNASGEEEKAMAEPQRARVGANALRRYNIPDQG